MLTKCRMHSISTVTIIALCLILYFGKIENRLSAVSFAMIISGGIGNMIDRTALGYVVDFIDFRLINFAIFNAADSFVCSLRVVLWGYKSTLLLKIPI